MSIAARSLAPAARQPQRSPASGTPFRVPAFLTLHILLAFAMVAEPAIATAHALATVGISILIVLHTRRLRTVAGAAAYISVCDVLWRMSNAQFFYEGAKYAVAILLVLGFVRLLPQRRGIALPLLYFGCFLPSALVTLMIADSAVAPGLISSTISGPLALAAAVLFFSRVRADIRGLTGVFWAILAPILAIYTIAARSTAIAGDQLEFGVSSNFLASGGFGPNQVSSALALGVMVCVLLAFLETGRGMRWFAILLALPLLAQNLLTFSRGGVVSLLAGLCAFGVALARSSGAIRRLVLLLAVPISLLMLIIIPRLEVFTGGALSERYTSLDTTRRSELASIDLQVFRDSFVFGEGLGMSRYRRDLGRGPVAPHTEFTRLLAEQGFLGALAGALVLAMALRSVSRASAGASRALASAMTVWSLVTMMSAATRIAAVSFLFGFAFATANFAASVPTTDTFRPGRRSPLTASHASAPRDAT